MKVLFLSNQEAELLTQQDKMVFLRLLKKQPSKGYDEIDDSAKHEEYPRGKYVKFVKQVNEFERRYIFIPLRYPSGEYGVKETWRQYTVSRGLYDVNDLTADGLQLSKGSREEIIYRYKASHPDSPCGTPWRSPVTMPDEAIRWTIKVETTVKRVQELTNDEALAMSIISGEEKFNITSQSIVHSRRWAFMNHWNDLHARPVRKGDGYSYESNPYIELISVVEKIPRKRS